MKAELPKTMYFLDGNLFILRDNAPPLRLAVNSDFSNFILALAENAPEMKLPETLSLNFRKNNVVNELIIDSGDERTSLTQQEAYSFGLRLIQEALKMEPK